MPPGGGGGRGVSPRGGLGCDVIMLHYLEGERQEEVGKGVHEVLNTGCVEFVSAEIKYARVPNCVRSIILLPFPN